MLRLNFHDKLFLNELHFKGQHTSLNVQSWKLDENFIYVEEVFKRHWLGQVLSGEVAWVVNKFLWIPSWHLNFMIISNATLHLVSFWPCSKLFLKTDKWTSDSLLTFRILWKFSVSLSHRITFFKTFFKQFLSGFAFCNFNQSQFLTDFESFWNVIESFLSAYWNKYPKINNFCFQVFH